MKRRIKIEREIGERLKQFLEHRITQVELDDSVIEAGYFTKEQEKDVFSDILAKETIGEIDMLDVHGSHLKEYDESIRRLRVFLPCLLGEQDYEHSLVILGHISEHIPDKGILDLVRRLDSLSDRKSVGELGLVEENHPYKVLLNEAIRLRRVIVEWRDIPAIGYDDRRQLKRDLDSHYDSVMSTLKGEKGFPITILYTKEGDVKFRRTL